MRCEKLQSIVETECRTDMRKIDLGEILVFKVSPDTAPDKEPVSVEVQLTKLEIERECIWQRAAQESAMLELDRDRMRGVRMSAERN